MALVVGQTVPLSGFVTTLGSIAMCSPAEVATRLGFYLGKMSRGYWICLLKEELQPEDFEYGGTALRSGARMGLPASTEKQDMLRPRVHDTLLKHYGQAGYERAQRADLKARIQPFGIHRIAKIVTVYEHMRYASPAKQYPQGGPELQYVIRRDHAKRFLVAAFVDAQGKATTPGFSVQIGTGAPDADRHQLRRYLEMA